MRDELADYWSLSASEVAGRLASSLGGLSQRDAQERLARYGPNELREQHPLTRWWVLWNQLRNPLLLLLVFAAGASAFTGEWVDATLVVIIVLASVGIGYSREYQAQRALDELKSRVKSYATVLRDNRPRSLPSREVVPGDVFLLSAGSLIPADAIIIEAVDCFVSEAVLTGESFPVEKRCGSVSAAVALASRANCVFMGSNVRSGTARCLAVRTGRASEFGAIAHRLALRPPETEFDHGIRRFGYLLTSAMLVMILLVLITNVSLGRPPLETLLFSIALAVGLSPELLPAILSINLSRSAQMMARLGVLVRRLNAIENLGSMNVLCTDKTGTLTEGVIRLEGAYGPNAQPSPSVLADSALNAALQAGLQNPLDEAILQAAPPVRDKVEKLAEIPYDFVRKRLGVVLKDARGVRLITKGAFHKVLEACTTSGGAPLDDESRQALANHFDEWSTQGTRVLAVATRMVSEQPSYERDDERELDFSGFLTFQDRPKEGVRETLEQLARLHVAVKLITGDAKLVAEHVARSVGMKCERVLTGAELNELHDEALWHAAEKTDLFAEVDPNQKERIILALKRMGHVVGFLGDGVNDAPAMHAADASLSVETATDVAKEAADFVLLERKLDVIRRGIEEGRRTFANTLKYVLMTTSANLGNMVSMAAASLFLPFLPLLAGQVLLNNFLSDVPAVGLADDDVDPELVSEPRRWNLQFIGRYMLEFGLLSSLFDLVTFAVLLWLFSASVELFRTGWFVESLLTELAVALVVRTQRPFFRSRPGRLLLSSTLVVGLLALAIPYLPGTRLVGFVQLPPAVLLTLVLITGLYVAATELAKLHFYGKIRTAHTPVEAPTLP